MKNDLQHFISKLAEIEYLIKVGRYKKARELMAELREELEK